MTDNKDRRGYFRPALLRATFLAAALCLTVIYAYFATRQDLLHPVKLYLILYAAAFGVYAYVGARLLPALDRNQKLYVPLILAVGLVFRLILIAAKPSLSTDIYRYIWDGRLILHGINPYHWAPFDGRLARFRDAAIWFPMEYKYYNTVYMPVSQAIFALNAAIFGTSIAGFKLVYALIDALVMGLIAVILRARNLPVINVYWYAWCPLPITEIALSGHQDVVGVALLLSAFLLMLRDRPLPAAALLVAAGFTKGFAFLLLPLFARRYGAPFIRVAVIALLILGMPLYLCLPSFLHGMKQYLGTVHVNSGIFHFVYTGFRMMLAPGDAYDLTSRLSNVVVLWIMWWSVRRPIDTDDEIIRRSIIVIAVCLLVVPTLFPWYIVWLLPLVTVFRRKPSTAFIVISGTVVLMYFYYFQYTILWWFRLLEYAPFYTLIWLEYRRRYWLPAEDLGPGVSDLPGASVSVNDGGADGCPDPAACK
ncbi:MAG: hypothetical protein P4L33_17920 [Capsulimonadaceae bacterium]|nr:hypothetical protein [Capsulimonadaceae bacterium]